MVDVDHPKPEDYRIIDVKDTNKGHLVIRDVLLNVSHPILLFILLLCPYYSSLNTIPSLLTLSLFTPSCLLSAFMSILLTLLLFSPSCSSCQEV